ncbi:MAG: class I SAM-dependent methyltransferase [Halobacteriaceae archaeon]
MSRLAATRRFYARWAALYDAVATYTPGVGSLRARAADRLGLSPGDTVVDLGCGTGANFPHLRERVGAAGRVVGVDVTGAMLARARDRAAEWTNVHVCRADAADPPLPPTGRADAVVASFLVGMLDDPADAVASWLDVLGRDGRLALLDAAPSPRTAAAPLNLALRGFVWLANPGKFEREEPAAKRLARRVRAAHGELAARTQTVTERRALGVVRLTVGRV